MRQHVPDTQNIGTESGKAFGRFVYENGKLSYIINADGVLRAVYNDPQALTMIEPEININLYPGSGEYLKGFTREIHLKDHLGNVRAVFDYSKLQSENHYYPFGLPIHNLCASTAPEGKENRYLYNGKELQDDLGLNWMDYGARFYDAGIGRWHSVDPMEQFHSPYVYAANNPVNVIDPSGMWAEDSKEKENLWKPEEDDEDVDYYRNLLRETMHPRIYLPGPKPNPGVVPHYNGIVDLVSTAIYNLFFDEQKLPDGNTVPKVKAEVAALAQGPVAIIISTSGSGSIAVGGVEAESGIVIVLRGKDKGVYPILDMGGVLASTHLAGGGACVKATGVFYTRDPDKFKLERHINGTRIALNVSVGAPVPGLTPTINFGGFKGTKNVDSSITYGIYVGGGAGASINPLDNMITGSISIGGTNAGD